jgi:2,4-dienoyl-CoA reductase-like NADH-dependent reductase (Old Yellow Enzyme family)/thioredoxin reductase
MTTDRSGVPPHQYGLRHVFAPINVGTLTLTQRVVVPPHGGGNGNLMGTPDEFEQHCALWLAKVRGGMQWVGGGPNFVANRLPPGFEPTGVGSHGPGFFRMANYAPRIGEFATRIHDGGGLLSVQMVLQGGMPMAPSNTLSGYTDHRVPHRLDLDEVAWLINEYAESAALAIDAGVDAIELHANHDDVIQWFLSPLTNHRTDHYGGTFENRRRFLRDITEAIRARASRPFTFGLRLCMDECIDGGFGVDECAAVVSEFTREHTVDYFSLDVGNNWGAPSYIQMNWHDDAQWAALCGEVKQATHLPVIYAGRVLDLETAEQVLANGHADIVAMARATMADPELVNKARSGRDDTVRPCIGLNECIHRKVVEGLVYACGVNPTFAREHQLSLMPDVSTPAHQRVVVVGGGPAGMELAALCAERGHEVELWDQSTTLGGALSVAARARGNVRYQRWIDYQSARLDRLGVTLQLGRTAGANEVLFLGSDVIAVATGATSRRPHCPGTQLPHVFTIPEALSGAMSLGPRVAVIVEDDGPAPLTVADHLAGLGHRVTFISQSPGPAPLVGKYSLGSMLARVIDDGVEFVSMARVTAIHADRLELASTFGSRQWTLDGFDSVVLACGSIPNDGLYAQLKHRHPNVHLLGDAYAPRRVVFATRQAWALADVIDHMGAHQLSLHKGASHGH